MTKIKWLLFMALPLLVCCDEQDTTGKQKKLSVADLGIDTMGSIPQGLDVGAPAPGFEQTTVDGQIYSLEEALSSGPVVLVFYRGKWCPVCQGYLSRFKDSMNLITDKGAGIIAITPEATDNAAEMIERTGFPLPVIADTSEQIMRNYDVLFDVTGEYAAKIEQNFDADISEINLKEEARLPVPATYIIGKDGKIKWRHFDLNYKNRASVKEISDNL